MEAGLDYICYLQDISKELRKSAILLIEPVISSIYSRFTQSAWSRIIFKEQHVVQWSRGRHSSSTRNFCIGNASFAPEGDLQLGGQSKPFLILFIFLKINKQPVYLVSSDHPKRGCSRKMKWGIGLRRTISYFDRY